MSGNAKAPPDEHKKGANTVESIHSALITTGIIMTDFTEKAINPSSLYTSITFRDMETVYWFDLGLDESAKILDGFIYVLSNESMPGIFKIGLTARDPETRMKELSSATGLPTPFKLELSWHCENLLVTEQAIHQDLEQYRVNKDREFFKCDLDEIKKAISEYGLFKRGDCAADFFEMVKLSTNDELGSDTVKVSISRDTFESLNDCSAGDIGALIDGMIKMIVHHSLCHIRFTDGVANPVITPSEEHFEALGKESYIPRTFTRKITLGGF